MLQKIEFVQKEARILYFYVTKDNIPMNLTGASFGLEVFSKDNKSVIVSKEDTDFIKNNLPEGEFSVLLTSDDLDKDAYTYKAELTITQAPETYILRFRLRISNELL